MSLYLGNSKVSLTISGDTGAKCVFTDDGSVGGDVTNVKFVSVNGAPIGDGQTRFYVEVGDGETVTLQIGRNNGGSYALVINWGDGNVEEYTPPNSSVSYPGFSSYLAKTHTYTIGGKYSIVPIDTNAAAANRYRFGMSDSSISTHNTQIFAAEIGLNTNGDSTLGSYGFKYCDNLKSVYIYDNVAAIPNSAFRYCSNASIHLPTNLTSIGDYAFYSATSVSFTELPNSLNTLGSNAFYSTKIAITSIPNGVTTIPTYCFSVCSNITNITLHANITNIGDAAFRFCSNLESVTVLATTPPTLGANVFDSNKSGRKIYVPAASLDAYKSATNWSSYASYMEAIPS